MLYELLAGTIPFRATTLADTLKKVIGEDPPAIASIESRAPAELAAICQRAMSKDPSRRYQSARDLAEEVKRYQSGAFVQAHKYGFSEHLRRAVSWNMPLVLMSIAAAVLAAYAYWQVNQERAGALVTVMVAASLVLFVASLRLPMFYGAEIFGLMHGWMLIKMAFLSGTTLLFPIGISYLATPVSVLAAQRNYWLAAGVAAFGLLVPVFSLATQGLYINRFLKKKRVLNSGGLCSFGGSALMLGPG